MAFETEPTLSDLTLTRSLINALFFYTLFLPSIKSFSTKATRRAETSEVGGKLTPFFFFCGSISISFASFERRQYHSGAEERRTTPTSVITAEAPWSAPPTPRPAMNDRIVATEWAVGGWTFVRRCILNIYLRDCLH